MRESFRLHVRQKVYRYLAVLRRMEAMSKNNCVSRLRGIVGIGMLTISMVVAAQASDKPVTGDTVIRKTQEAMKATKDFTIQQKDAFERQIQTELGEMKVSLSHLREQLQHASGKTRVDLQKTIADLETKIDLANKKLQSMRSATTSSWEQAKLKTEAVMNDLRSSLHRAQSYLPSR